MKGSWPYWAMVIILVVQIMAVLSMLLLMIGLYNAYALFSVLLLTMVFTVLYVPVILVLLEIPIRWFPITLSNRTTFIRLLQLLLLFDLLLNLFSLIVRTVWIVEPGDTPCDVFEGQCIALATITGLFIVLDVLQIVISNFYGDRPYDPTAFKKMGRNAVDQVFDERMSNNVKAYRMDMLTERLVDELDANPKLAKRLESSLSKHRTQQSVPLYNKMNDDQMEAYYPKNDEEPDDKTIPYKNAMLSGNNLSYDNLVI